MTDGRSRCVAVVLALTTVAGLAHAEPRRPVRGDVPHALVALAPAEPAPADMPLARVTVLLGLRDPEGLDALLAAQQDPRAAAYHRWLDAPEIADRFGPSRAEYERVRRWLVASGLAVVGDSPFRTSLAIAGTAAAIGRAFDTPIRLFRERGGRRRTFHAAEREPRLPLAVADAVHAIVGLDDLPAFQPLVRLADGTLTLSPRDFATVYDVGALQAAGLSGAGRSIAVIARSNFPEADVAAFSSLFLPATPAMPVEKVLVGTDPGLLSPPEEVTEVLLDSEWAGALAPAARVRVVIGTPSGNIPEALETAVASRLGDVITVSFGLCEPLARLGATELFDVLYAIANLQGQTVVVASGDAGAAGCLPGSPRVAVNAIASSPHALAVGGTRLAPSFDADGNATGYAGETVWNDADGRSGGGESVVFARPRYQLGPGLGTFRGRALPDVALAASPAGFGYAVVKNGTVHVVGGTSAGAPALAGVLALIAERTGGIGQLVPAIYRIAGEQLRGLRAPVFHDVTVGDNGLFAAEPGFDLATGWGSPSFAALAAALPHPALCDGLEDCLVPGAGGRRRGCVGEWSIESASLARRRNGTPRPRQSCRDGDAACDADATTDGQCTLRVALCVNVLDARRVRATSRPACEPGTIRRIRLLAPQQRNAPQRAAVAAALATLPDLPLQLRDACTATVPVTVPAGPAGRPGRLRLRARIDGSGGSTLARATLTCSG